MPGVLVDDQSFSLDAMSQAFLLDSLSSPASCGSPLSLPFQTSSPSPAPAPCLQPCFTRAFSQNSSDAELSCALSQLSPFLHHHRHATPRAAGGLGRSSRVGAMEGLGLEEFLGERFAGDQQGPNCEGSVVHRSGELVFGGLPAGISELQFAARRPRAGSMYTGNELEEQDVGLPFSSGGPLWGGQTAGGGGGGFLVGSPTLPDAVLALQKFLPSNLEDEEAWPAVDVYSCDEFRMFEFKVKRCMRGRSHDWTECPFSHPGEKARRRDPRRFHYSGTACPDFRKGNCKRGDACEFAHGVFECWLHPARYRTQPCKDERNCKRRVCFFAHTPEQLRLLPTAQAANGGSPRSSSSSSPPLKSALAQKLAQCAAAAASYDGSPLRCCAMGAPFVDASQIIDAGSPPPGFRDAVTVDGASPFARLGSFGTSNGTCRSTASLLSSGYLGSSLHHSPASNSPPLSPSMSPPGSPDDWSSSLTKNFSCLAIPGTPSSSLGQTGSLAQFAFSGQSVHPLQNQAGVPAHRRHLDRLNPALSLSIPADQGRSYSALSSPTSACPQSSNQTEDLIALLKQAELSGPEAYWLQAQAAQTATMIAPKFSSGPSPLRRGFQSVPGTPTKMGWKSAEVDLWGLNERKAEPALERVESGRCLRAKIFESLVKGNEQGSNDDPDVGWVNELVKEELR